MRDTFEAIRDDPTLDISLLKGRGKTTRGEIRIPNLSRNGRLSVWLSRRAHRQDHWIEQVTFSLCMIPVVLMTRPHVIYFVEDSIGRILWRWKRISRQKYRLLLRNCGPIYPPFNRVDGVQQVTPSFLSYCLEHGEPANKQLLLPEMHSLPNSHDEEVGSASARATLGLPMDRKIVLAVGAINASHKRMDYVIQEHARLAPPRPVLIMLGQRDNESTEIENLAERLLPEDDWIIRTVPASEVGLYYRSADVFVLGSTFEGFGRVYVEALAWGLPCLTHDFEAARYVLGDLGTFGDLTQAGSLATLVQQVLTSAQDPGDVAARRARAHDTFGDVALRPLYSTMLREFAAGKDLAECGVTS